MAKHGFDDGLEIIGYFAWFWVFVFSKTFRKAWIEEFKSGNWFGKLFGVVEVISSILFGLLLPLYLIYFFLLE